METAIRRQSLLFTDHHGFWCAYCLDYFPPVRYHKEFHERYPERMEYHHIVQEAPVRNRFGSSIPFKWCIPAHHLCHQAMQDDANTASSEFVRALRESSNLSELDKYAKTYFESGYYWLATLIKLDILQRRHQYLTDTALGFIQAEFLRAAAPLRGAHGLYRHANFNPSASDNPAVQLYLATLQADHGHFGVARKSLQKGTDIIQASPLPAPEKQDLQAVLAMRELQVHRRLELAERAVGEARTEFSKNTGMVLAGLIGLGGTRPKLDYAESIVHRMRDTTQHISWLYYAELRLIQGIIGVYTQDRIENIYQSLVLSEYILGILGLQMTSPDLELPGSRRQHNWTPGDVMIATPALRKLDPADCLSLRREVIGGPNDRQSYRMRLLGTLFQPLHTWRYGLSLQPHGPIVSGRVPT